MKTSSSNSNTFTSKRLDDFLKQYRAEKGTNITNTRIGSKDLNIYGGSYNIPDDKYSEFLDIYYKSKIQNNCDEYLTEKQLLEDGPLLVDIDLRYDSNIKTRQHSDEHIIDIITLYLNKIEEIYVLDQETKFNVYVLQKSDVNILEDKTKDGIHLIFTLKMSNEPYPNKDDVICSGATNKAKAAGKLKNILNSSALF